jgi:hypothetical protein
MTQAYMKTYVGIKDIMELFNIGYDKARIIYTDAKRLHSKVYSSLENQVLLEKVLESQGIVNVDFWYKQQEKKSKVRSV